MKWGWRQTMPDTWRFDDRLSVVKHWAMDSWSVVRDGFWFVESFPTAQAAIEAAEKLMEGEK